MTDTPEDERAFFSRVDAFLKLANDQCEGAERPHVSASFLFAVTRFHAWEAARTCKSGDEMASLFSEVPEAIANTLTIAEQCDFDFSFGGSHYPDFSTPKGETKKTLLRNLAEDGLKNRLRQLGIKGKESLRYRERLDMELDVLNGQFGIMLWSASPNDQPLFGGTLCVGSPILRSPVLATGGNAGQPDCSGQLSFHFSHAYMSSFFLSTHDSLYAQYWYRDPGFAAPNAVGFTDALHFVLCP